MMWIWNRIVEQTLINLNNKRIQAQSQATSPEEKARIQERWEADLRFIKKETAELEAKQKTKAQKEIDEQKAFLTERQLKVQAAADRRAIDTFRSAWFGKKF